MHLICQTGRFGVLLTFKALECSSEAESARRIGLFLFGAIYTSLSGWSNVYAISRAITNTVELFWTWSPWSHIFSFKANGLSYQKLTSFMSRQKFQNYVETLFSLLGCQSI